MATKYDVQQVCENGHQVTDCYNINPEKQKKYCQECGAATLTACPGCGEAIQGARLRIWQKVSDPRVMSQAPFTPQKMISGERTDVPSYCPVCGKAYPWKHKKIVAAIQTLMEFGDLEDKEKETIVQDVENIAKDVPEAELSARRIKRIWERGKEVGYEAIMEFASRTAAKILKD